MNHLNELLRRLPMRCAWIFVAVFALSCGAHAVKAADAPAVAATISVTVTGAVASPGVRKLPVPAHLDDALRLASPSLDADLSVVGIRNSDNTEHQETINYMDYLTGKDLDRDVALKDGDVISVPHKQSSFIEVSVRGPVVSPGRFTLPAQSTVLDAISAAKGLTDNADRKGMAIQHANEVAQMPFDFDAATVNHSDLTVNPVLNDGDIVIIHSVAHPSVFTITGGVVKPGEYSIGDTSLTLMSAIQKAGGVADRAKLNDVTIQRSDATGKVTTVKVKAVDAAAQSATVIQPGDNINVPQGAPPQRMDPLSIIGLAVTLIAVIGHH